MKLIFPNHWPRTGGFYRYFQSGPGNLPRWPGLFLLTLAAWSFLVAGAAQSPASDIASCGTTTMYSEPSSPGAKTVLGHDVTADPPPPATVSPEPATTVIQSPPSQEESRSSPGAVEIPTHTELTVTPDHIESEAGGREAKAPTTDSSGSASKEPSVPAFPTAGIAVSPLQNKDDLERISQMTGIPRDKISEDYSPEHVVSTRSTVSRSGNVTTWFLQYARTDDILPNLKETFQAEINSGDIQLSGANTTNVIIIRSKTPGAPIVQDVMDVIRTLDFRPGQVLIDVLLVELSVTNSDLFDFELKALGRSPFGMGNTAGTVALDHGQIDQNNPTTTYSGFKALITSQNKLKLFLNAAKTKDRINIISSPHIVAANHRTAEFHLGESVPVIQDTRPSDAGPINSYISQDIGIDLVVTPHINRSGEIDLEIHQTANELLSYDATQKTARTARREVKTNITVPDGETLILGGFIEEKTTVRQSKIPLLSQIPMIGKAFTKKESRKEKTELLVFLTPHTLDTLEEGQRITRVQAAKSSFKDRLAKLIEDCKHREPAVGEHQEILIDRASREWQYDFGTEVADILTWQVPAQFDTSKVRLRKVGSCPFGYGSSKRLQPPFIRTLLKPSDGFVFRKEFFVEDPAAFSSLSLKVASDNAAAVYLNGRLVDEDPSIKLKDGHDYEYWNRTRDDVPATVLQAGTNDLIVLLGNDKTTTDGYFDFMLIANKPVPVKVRRENPVSR